MKNRVGFLLAISTIVGGCAGSVVCCPGSCDTVSRVI